MEASLVVQLQQVFEGTIITMPREAEVADAAFLLLFYEPVGETVVYEAALADFQTAEILVRFGVATATTGAVQQEVVDIVGLQFLQGVLEHRLRRFQRPLVAAEIREFGGYEILVARIALEGNAGAALAEAAAVDRTGIEIIDAVLEGVVYLAVDHLLVEGTCHWIVGSTLRKLGQTHHTVAEEGYDIAGVGVDAGGHRIPSGPGCRAGLAGREEGRSRNSGRSAACQIFQEIAAGYGLIHLSLFF